MLSDGLLGLGASQIKSRHIKISLREIFSMEKGSQKVTADVLENSLYYFILVLNESVYVFT